MAEREVFGTTAKGETVHRVKISGGGLTAYVMTWGAVIQDLRLEGHEAPLVLGFERFEDYPQHSSYFGATPGRCANRITGGRFELDGKQVQLELNEKGVTHLHGGSDGMAKRNWEIIELVDDRVVLQIVDPDGRAGYPGNCTVTATYHLHGDGVLTVLYESSADQPSPCSICQHTYFNLDGSDTALGHDIQIAADRITAVDEHQCPTGVLLPVEDTVFDLRGMGPMDRQENGERVLFDHNFCLSDQRVEKRHVATARSDRSGVSLEVLTTEPGVQFYSGYKLNVAVPGHGGRRYGPFAGFCLETQIWPDAINHNNFPEAVLRPGEILRQETEYVFRRN
ncbi:aldose epimerase family protein [Rhizobium halophilum]|uniref:aldose epimerase family protein n=1 Tax=Rhizobium halophilum TaxID=2846852 RepID=UPI001EFE946F|nr:aldose epimerase family protein [Rhizobium halophilum]MCF6368862.1 galactose mutarotase [Rhizobium halophilum]